MNLPASFHPELIRHYELLCRWNPKLNLVSKKSLNEAETRHYGESLLLASRLPQGPLRVVDVGSGAGFPGFVVAAVRSDCQVTLIEGDQRKSTFLREASRELPNVRVLSVRAESVEERFDWMTMRAVRWEAEFIRLAHNFALLLGKEDAEALPTEIAWDEAERLPGSKSRVLRLGRYVPRETL
jgi:16S rRNA (guanine(527)-N(7))-methyltransferase RsmG